MLFIYIVYVPWCAYLKENFKVLISIHKYFGLKAMVISIHLNVIKSTKSCTNTSDNSNVLNLFLMMMNFVLRLVSWTIISLSIFTRYMPLDCNSIQNLIFKFVNYKQIWLISMFYRGDVIRQNSNIRVIQTVPQKRLSSESNVVVPIKMARPAETEEVMCHFS